MAATNKLCDCRIQCFFRLPVCVGKTARLLHVCQRKGNVSVKLLWFLSTAFFNFLLFPQSFGGDFKHAFVQQLHWRLRVATHL